MKRKCVVLILLLALAAIGRASLVGQQPKLIQGPTVNYGQPLAPVQDTYYPDGFQVAGSDESWIPDEFLSNPDPSIDMKALKGYHMPPILHWVKVLNPVVKAGDTVRFEALVEDKTAMNPWPMGFHGPNGRRTEFNVQMRPSKDNPFKHEGTLRVHKWAEPGLYFLYTLGIISNELGHSKAYFQDYHPGLKDAYFTVLPHDDVDVTPPVLEDFRIGDPASAAAEIPSFDIAQAIPVYARVTDNLAGVQNVRVRFINSLGRYTETNLMPMFDKKDWFVSAFRLPKHYIGGEYKVVAVSLQDNAGQKVVNFGATNPKLKDAKFTIRQQASEVDSVPPRLIGLNVDKKQAALGDEITITAIVIDDKSGVGTLAVDFAAMPSYIDKRRVHLKPVPVPTVIQKSGFDLDTNTYTGSFKTHVMDEPGEWHVVRVMARDNADNLLDMRHYEFPELANVKINFTGGSRTPGSAPTTSQSTSMASPAAAQTPGKIRRVDMTPPHPPRGACLNCHEP